MNGAIFLVHYDESIVSEICSVGLICQKGGLTYVFAVRHAGCQTNVVFIPKTLLDLILARDDAGLTQPRKLLDQHASHGKPVSRSFTDKVSSVVS